MSNKRRPNATCERCGQPYYIAPAEAVSRHCSRACRYADRRAYQCETCGKSFYRRGPKVPRYCSMACRGGPKRLAMCEQCGKPMRLLACDVKVNRRFCSARCWGLARNAHGLRRGYIRKKRATGHRTDIEALAEAVLQQRAIPYLFEHQVGRYSIDFALPTLGIGLECDGWHHTRPEQRERDQRRDAYLTRHGWRMVRIGYQALYADADHAVATALGLH